jgi:hypothetical protein
MLYKLLLETSTLQLSDTLEYDSLLKANQVEVRLSAKGLVG